MISKWTPVQHHPLTSNASPPSQSLSYCFRYPDKKQLKGERGFFPGSWFGESPSWWGIWSHHITAKKHRTMPGSSSFSLGPFQSNGVTCIQGGSFHFNQPYFRKSFRERPWANLISYPESLPRWFQILPSWQLKAAITFSLSLQCHPSKDSPSASHKHWDWAVLSHRVSSVL